MLRLSPFVRQSTCRLYESTLECLFDDTKSCLALRRNHVSLDRDKCTLASTVRVTTMNVMSGIVLFLSTRVQNMFSRLRHDHVNSGYVLFSLSIIHWINKAATGKIEQVEADYENIASDWLKVWYGMVTLFKHGISFRYTFIEKKLTS